MKSLDDLGNELVVAGREMRAVNQKFTEAQELYRRAVFAAYPLISDTTTFWCQNKSVYFSTYQTGYRSLQATAANFQKIQERTQNDTINKLRGNVFYHEQALEKATKELSQFEGAIP